MCKKGIHKNETISPFFEHDRNLWRHVDCFQIFYISALKYFGVCTACMEELQIGKEGYWSKHNGVWCVTCGEDLFPKVVVSFSREQDLIMKIRRIKA